MTAGDPLDEIRDELSNAPVVAASDGFEDALWKRLRNESPRQVSPRRYFQIAGIAAVVIVMVAAWATWRPGESPTGPLEASGIQGLAMKLSVAVLEKNGSAPALAMIQDHRSGQTTVCGIGDTVAEFTVVNIESDPPVVFLRREGEAASEACAVLTDDEISACSRGILAAASAGRVSKECLRWLSYQASRGREVAKLALRELMDRGGETAALSRAALYGEHGAPCADLIKMTLDRNRPDREQIILAIYQHGGAEGAAFVAERMRDESEPLRARLLDRIVERKDISQLPLLMSISQSAQNDAWNARLQNAMRALTGGRYAKKTSLPPGGGAGPGPKGKETDASSE